MVRARHGWTFLAVFFAAPGANAQELGDAMTQGVPGTEVAIAFRFLPGGTFNLGSLPGEPGRDDDEGPVRGVRLTGFWMSAHEITHDQFGPFRYRRLDDDVGAAKVQFDADAVTRPSPPYEDPAHGMPQGGHPATGMTRLSALHYARWLSTKTGRLYRLPTEAEWEYACKSGGSGPFGAGSSAETIGAVAWFEADAGDVYHPVGSKAPNTWGLYDMHGNVAEWVMDEYAADAYAALPDGAGAFAENPMSGRLAAGRGLVRGGAFDDPVARLRCSERFQEPAAWKRRDPQIPRSRWWNTDSQHVGFRLVSPMREYPMDEILAYWAEVLGG